VTVLRPRTGSLSKGRAGIGRRGFLALCGGTAAAAAWPLAARAQQPGRIYQLGILHNQGPQAPQFPPFYDELRKLGFVEGQNLIVDSRGYAQPTDQFPAVAAELAKAQLDAILCGGAAATRAAQQATRTIPLLTFSDDLVGAGLVASLARPGGNTTGISILATELDGKRQEILMEMVPGARRMAALADANTAASQNMRALEDATRARGVELSIHLVDRPERIVPMLDEAKSQGAEAINVLASPVLHARRFDIFERMVALRLPAIYQAPEFPEEGGLIGYGPRLTILFRQLARQTAKVLRGDKPSDVPVEQPTTFELVVNMKAAKAIGLEVPPALALRADKVIE
jgi:putative tryptophan/tyrosine transport system substrate-binding protein